MRRLMAMAAVLACATAPAVAADYTVQTVAEGLSYPWSLAFLPDGSMLVTERPGTLRRLAADGTLGAPITGVPAPYVRSQGGLFDVLPTADFASTGVLLLSYAAGTPDANHTAVVRARLDGDTLVDVEPVVAVTPDKDTPVHYGGRIAWHPDGTLLLTTGDGFDYREQAQSLTSRLGKTLRVKADGSIPASNPFTGRDDADPAIWTWGHRSPQGLAVDPQTGRVYQHEHGPRGGDEVNVLRSGRNYGWPLVTFGMDYNGAHVSPFTEWGGMEPPLHHWTPSIAPSGMTVYRGAQFPEWDGDLLVGALVDREVRRLDLDARGQVVGEEALFGELGERIRDVRTGPDGAVYLLTDADPGRVLRVVSNRPPAPPQPRRRPVARPVAPAPDPGSADGASVVGPSLDGPPVAAPPADGAPGNPPPAGAAEPPAADGAAPPSPVIPGQEPDPAAAGTLDGVAPAVPAADPAAPTLPQAPGAAGVVPGAGVPEPVAPAPVTPQPAADGDAARAEAAAPGATGAAPEGPATDDGSAGP